MSTDNTIPAEHQCPGWCTDHQVLVDDPRQVVERIESHRAGPFLLRSAEDTPYFIALRLSQISDDGDPWEPEIGLYTHPENEHSIPVGLSVRQARLVAEALLRFVEQAECGMTEPCASAGCDRMTVSNAEGLCNPCRLDAYRARRPRLVKS